MLYRNIVQFWKEYTHTGGEVSPEITRCIGLRTRLSKGTLNIKLEDEMVSEKEGEEIAVNFFGNLHPARVNGITYNTLFFLRPQKSQRTTSLGKPLYCGSAIISDNGDYVGEVGLEIKKQPEMPILFATVLPFTQKYHTFTQRLLEFISRFSEDGQEVYAGNAFTLPESFPRLAVSIYGRGTRALANGRTALRQIFKDSDRLLDPFTHLPLTP